VSEEGVQRKRFVEEAGHRMAQGGGVVGRVAVVGDTDDERDVAQAGIPREEGEETPTQRAVVVGEVEDDGGGSKETQDIVRAAAGAERAGIVTGVG